MGDVAPGLWEGSRAQLWPAPSTSKVPQDSLGNPTDPPRPSSCRTWGCELLLRERGTNIYHGIGRLV